MRKLFLFCYYLGLLTGAMGLLAVAGDLFIFNKSIFNNADNIQFFILIAFSFIIKYFILPKTNSNKVN